MGNGNGWKMFGLYGRLIMLARPYWRLTFGFLILSLTATPLALLTPWPLKIAVDSILGDRPLPRVLQAVLPEGTGPSSVAAIAMVAGLVVLFALLLHLQRLATAMVKTYVGEQLVMGFRSKLFRHVQRLSLAYHDTTGTADSVYRIQHDAPAIQTLMIDSLIPLISAVFMLCGMLWVTAQINTRLAVVAVAISPFLLLTTWSFSGRLRRRWREVKRLESSTQTVMQEVLSAVRVVKAFSRETHEQERYVTRYRQGVTARLHAAFQENTYGLLVGLTTAGGTAAVLFVGVSDVRSGAMSLGSLLLVMAYLKQLYEPLKTIGKQLATKQKALVSVERAFALLDELPEVEERPTARPLVRARGEVAFRNVSFGYELGHTVLSDINFEVPAGSRVGIAGTTGAGKTTLLNLLIRFYDPQQGQILIDGVDLRDYKLADLRNQFGIVLQEPILFSTTIAENIAYGRPGATQEEVIAAARAANSHDFIQAMPDGYATIVGERGMRLSGGERQRISLARAFLKDAPILILDEPTSSVDTGTESQIMEAMERLMTNRTTFMIAHRLSTLESCGVMLRMERGRLTSTDMREEISLRDSQKPQIRAVLPGTVGAP